MMDTAEMLRIFSRHRGDALVVPGRGGRHWVKISERPNRDLPLGDPAMGGHASFALGLALALPRERIVLFDSDGDIQMGMGILATIAEQQPKNFYHFIARACGYTRVHAIDNVETFAINVQRILSESGPVFTWLKVRPEVENQPIGARSKWRTRSQVQAVADLKKELG